jgi:hypothetical protein
MRSPTRAALLVTGSLLCAVGCAPAVGQPATATGAASSRPAAKETCPDVVWEPPAALHVTPTSRDLIGFGPTLLGVDTTWAGDGFTAETVAGGYVDDLTEAYDDLQVTGSLSLGRGIEAEVMRGRLLGDSVLVVVWRDPALAVPCDVHALLVTGADDAVEQELLGALRGPRGGP